mgnify:CR=1 FL=1
MGDEKETKWFRDLVGHSVVVADGRIAVAQVFLNDVVHVGRQINETLLDVAHLRPDAARYE